jgi:uncharacterized membrane protein
MTEQEIRATDRDSLARFLGWFSVGLGAAQLTAPRAMCRVVGADPTDRSAFAMRTMGARELVQGVGILTSARPTAWLWSRVAGDGLDLALLGLVGAKNRRLRTLFAALNVAGITVPDVYEALHLGRKQGPPRARKRIRKAITVRRPRQEVEARWTAAEELRRRVDRAGASVAMREAPGGRGTELSVEFEQDGPGGELATAVAKLTGRDLATELADRLRLLKQELETGEVVRSEATPGGHRLGGHLRQRPARPVEVER